LRYQAAECLTIAAVTLPILQSRKGASHWCNAKRRRDADEGGNFGKQSFPGVIDSRRPGVAQHVARVSLITRKKSTNNSRGARKDRAFTRSLPSLSNYRLRFGMLAKETSSVRSSQRCRKLEALLDQIEGSLIGVALERVAKKERGPSPAQKLCRPYYPRYLRFDLD
jgi:hypothetical protein